MATSNEQNKIKTKTGKVLHIKARPRPIMYDSWYWS